MFLIFILKKIIGRTNHVVLWVCMNKFHVKYNDGLDFDASEKKAQERGLFTARRGGRSSKDGTPTQAQLIIKLNQFQTTVLVSRTVFQVFWSGSSASDYEKLTEIEDTLRAILVPISGTKLGFRRVNVPTILEAQSRLEAQRRRLELKDEGLLLLQDVVEPRKQPPSSKSSDADFDKKLEDYEKRVQKFKKKHGAFLNSSKQ